MAQTECLRIGDSQDETRHEQEDIAANMDVDTKEKEWFISNIFPFYSYCILASFLWMQRKKGFEVCDSRGGNFLELKKRDVKL